MKRFLRALSLKQKLIGSYGLLILLTILLVFVSIRSINTSEDVASAKVNFLSQRYERTRNTIDDINKIHHFTHELIEKTADGNFRESDLSGAYDLLRSLKTHADALQTKRFPKEIGNVKKAADAYIDIYNNKLIPALKSGNIDEAKTLMSFQLTHNYVTICENM
ncbi:MAG: hypothetical protein ACI4NE_05665 [Succinivibrio sp.]